MAPSRTAQLRVLMTALDGVRVRVRVRAVAEGKIPLYYSTEKM